jgi:hypothetical protein
MEWDPNNFIRMFYFSRANIPLDIINKQPVPSNWGKPYARFAMSPHSSDCSSGHFTNQQMIFDTTFCGDWAGNPDVFSQSQCTSSQYNKYQCNDFVNNNPSEFSEAYWLINYLDIYDIVK